MEKGWLERKRIYFLNSVFILKTKPRAILALNNSKILKYCSLCFIPTPRIRAKVFLRENPDRHSSLLVPFLSHLPVLAAISITMKGS